MSKNDTSKQVPLNDGYRPVNEGYRPQNNGYQPPRNDQAGYQPPQNQTKPQGTPPKKP
jgi:hypothetical protein